MLKHYSNYWLLLALMAAIPSACFSQEKKVIDSLTAVLRKAEATGNDTLIISAMASLAISHSKNDPELALKISRKQLALAQSIDNKWGIANAYNLHGGVYDYKGDYDKALDHYNKALAAFGALGRRLDMIDINNSIGVIYAKKGIYSESLKYLLRGLREAIKEKDDLGLISTYNNIGIVYENQEQYDQALKYYLKCLQVQRKTDKGYSIHATLQNIGNLYLIKKMPWVALGYFNEGIKYATEQDDRPSLANNYSGIGDVYIYNKDWEKALENHYRAFEIRKSMDDGFGLLSSYLSLGAIYHQTGDDSQALDQTLKALQIVTRTGELNYKAKIYRQLSEIYAAQGDFRQAYENQRSYKQFNDSIFNAKNSKKLTEQQMNFDFKLIQEKKDAASKQALHDQKNIRNYSIGGLLLVALFIIILLRQRYKLATIKKQKAHEAAMQKLENEIAIKDIETQALKVENENILLKEEKMQEKLDFNQRELASATMYLYQKNEMLSGLRKEIDALPPAAVNPKQLEKIRSAIQNDHYVEADWERFRIHFEQVHPDFFKDLNEKHPGLTPYEVRLCAYLHLKMSTKEIAGLLNITPESVIKAKVRLNKKLNPPATMNDGSGS